MTSISTHVLDSVAGRPADGVAVSLTGPNGPIDHNVTDADGRIRFESVVGPGTHVLTYAVGPWADLIGRATLFPEIVLTFEVAPGESHYHLAVLFAGHSYTAYRGS